ncbi:MAG: hypothetical protein V4850_22455 [Myxococcota bacterium]
MDTASCSVVSIHTIPFEPPRERGEKVTPSSNPSDGILEARVP